MQCKPTIVERTWTKVDKTADCRLWTGALHPFGYGVLRCTQPTPHMHRAHRLVWELTFGPIPPGMQINHRCDIPACVRPDHLFPGSQADNIRDMMAKRRGGGQFKKGRPYDGYSRKLTDRQILEIRHRYAAGGIRQRDLAIEYGIHHVTVGMIVRRKTHKHLP